MTQTKTCDIQRTGNWAAASFGFLAVHNLPYQSEKYDKTIQTYLVFYPILLYSILF